jgi:hypothetical protein
MARKRGSLRAKFDGVMLLRKRSLENAITKLFSKLEGAYDEAA